MTHRAVLHRMQASTSAATVKLNFADLEKWKVVSKIVLFYKSTQDDKGVEAAHSRARLYLSFLVR